LVFRLLTPIPFLSEQQAYQTVRLI